MEIKNFVCQHEVYTIEKIDQNLRDDPCRKIRVIIIFAFNTPNCTYCYAHLTNSLNPSKQK